LDLSEEPESMKCMWGVGRSLWWVRTFQAFRSCRFLSVSDLLLSRLFYVPTQLPRAGRWASVVKHLDTAVKSLMVRRDWGVMIPVFCEVLQW